MSIRKVVAGLLIAAGIAIMAVPFFWRATGEKQTGQLISEFEQTLEDDYDEETAGIGESGNWLNGRMSCEQIEQLWCELIIPEQNKEQKESEE